MHYINIQWIRIAKKTFILLAVKMPFCSWKPENFLILKIEICRNKLQFTVLTNTCTRLHGTHCRAGAFGSLVYTIITWNTTTNTISLYVCIWKQYSGSHAVESKEKVNPSYNFACCTAFYVNKYKIHVQ